MKKTCFIILICSLFISCASSGVKIPGQAQKEENNLYIEYINIADEYLSLEKYDKAIKYYELALVNKETYWTVYYKLARTYALKKDWKNSEKMYKTLLERDENNSIIKSSLAYIYAMNGNLQKSEDLYKSLLSENEYNEDFLTNYISVLILNKKNSEAISLLNDLKEKFPNNKNIEIFSNKLEIKDN